MKSTNNDSLTQTKLELVAYFRLRSAIAAEQAAKFMREGDRYTAMIASLQSICDARHADAVTRSDK